MLSLQKKGAVQTKDGVEFAVIDGIVGAQGPVNTTSCRRRFSLHLHTDGAVYCRTTRCRSGCRTGVQ